ncbi:putative reverse transcriptase domain-containing protein [Tanacetum coccineum]
MTTLEGVNGRVTELSTTFDQETKILYGMMEDAQDDRTLLRGRVNILFRDRLFHHHTSVLMEQEARLSRAAWAQSMARTTEREAADRRRQEQLVQTLTLLKSCQTQLTAALRRIDTLEARGPAPPEAPEEAASRRKMAPKKRATRSNPTVEPDTTTTITDEQLQALIDQGVTAALAARDATRNGDDSHTSGTGAKRNERIIREMETVFRISNCSVGNQIKFSTCTLLTGALMLWNSHAMTVGNDVAYAMTWADLKKKMMDKYCPRNEIKKIESEMWNLKVQGTDVVAYNQRFQELALMCNRMFPDKSDKIERYVSGLPDMIYWSVVASKPRTMQDAIEMATELMDQKIRTITERQAENKRKFDDIARNNQNQQQQNKRQNTGRAYAIGNGDRRSYDGAKPLCPKFNHYYHGPCLPRCNICKRMGHLARDCM